MRKLKQKRDSTIRYDSRV